jgi:hypothetical protein
MTLMLGLGHPPVPLPSVGADWSRRGIGLSDAPPLVPALCAKLSYTNTFYDQFPQVDITRPPEILLGQLEFVVCSDVLEHVPPPLESALTGLLACLRPEGFAVVTVPVGADTTDEHYPGLTDFEVIERQPSGYVVEWTDVSGARHSDVAPEMHGGPGLTLAFRWFSAQDITARLLAAGFASVYEPPAVPELGIPAIGDPGVFLARKGPATPLR